MKKRYITTLAIFIVGTANSQENTNEELCDTIFLVQE